jgi:hypothetical protein
MDRIKHRNLAKFGYIRHYEARRHEADRGSLGRVHGPRRVVAALATLTRTRLIIVIRDYNNADQAGSQ